MKKVGAHAISQHQEALKEHAEWEWQFGQVAAFVQAHGHAELGAHPAGEWLRWQMRLAEAGELTPGRRERLTQAGITLPVAVKQGQKKTLQPPAATEDEEWERMHARLDAWQQLHGHCEVWPEGREQAELARWVKRQRRLHVARRLSAAQSARLDALGLFRDRSGTDRAQLWEQRFQEMAAFAREHGHTNVMKWQNKDLAHWRDVQREFRRKGMLKAERVARLEGIGFEWGVPGKGELSKAGWFQQLWEEKLALLVAFKARFGHCHVPVLWEEDPKLGEWVAGQRKRWREGKLEDDRVKRLEGMGFQRKVPYRFFQPPFVTERQPQQMLLDLWEKRFAELVAFQHEHGHANVKVSQNRALNYWRETQREFRRKGKLSAERIARLDAIGFEWEKHGRGSRSWEEVKQGLWEEKLARLVAFHARFGHTQVPKDWPEDPALATWTSMQRRAKQRRRLKAEREARLDELGFDWRPQMRPLRVKRRETRPAVSREALWEQRYAELLAFHAQHWHCVVPNNRPEVHALSKWCYTQRRCRRQGTLRGDRIVRLDALDFRWDATAVPGLSYAERHDLLWEQSFARLVAFHAQHGHAQVPAHWSEDVELGRWVDKQRQKARAGRLQAEKRTRLDALGFPWQPGYAPVLKPRPLQNFPKPAHEKVWQQHLEELRAFQQEHGHLRVPTKMRKLSCWCLWQRKVARRGKLTPGRRSALETLGFAWEV